MVSLSIRLEPELKRRVEVVAALGSVKPADVIRICVINGLGIVEEHFRALQQSFGRERLRAVALRKFRQRPKHSSPAQGEHGLPSGNDPEDAS